MQHPLLRFSPVDTWTVADACEGVQIFGATGSGKTSGSGAALARAMLLAGYGGLVLTAKPDDRAMWEGFAKQTGRQDDVVVFGVDQPHRLNFLSYEFERSKSSGAKAGITENLVALFSEVFEVADRETGAKGSPDPFWDRALRQLLRNAIDLAVLGTGTVSLHDLFAIVMSSPLDEEMVSSPQWLQSSRCGQLLHAAQSRELTPVQRGDLELTARFWLEEFPRTPDRTRSSITATFTTMADGFMRGQLRELFGTTTTLTPERTHDGAIIIVDLPVKVFHQLGRVSQVLWKYLWQRATEARSVIQKPRPVFLWADEAQNFVTSRDMDFQATARSSRACTVYLTQSMSTYHAVLGKGAEGQAAADTLVGNLQTKIFHAQGDTVTNEWAERLFAKSWSWRSNTSSTDSPDKRRSRNLTAGVSQSLESEIMAGEFTTLRKGGPANKGLVDAIVFQGGRTWKATKCNSIRVTFEQRSS